MAAICLPSTLCLPQNKNQRITKVGAELKQKRAHKVWSGKIGNDTFNHEIKPTNNIKTNPNKNTKPKHHLSHFNSFHSHPFAGSKTIRLTSCLHFQFRYYVMHKTGKIRDLP